MLANLQSGLDSLRHTTRRRLQVITEASHHIRDTTLKVREDLKLYYDLRSGSNPSGYKGAPRTILPSIALGLEEAVRAGGDTVNLAYNIQEAIERQLSLIDHAIEQQEMELSNDNGINLPPVIPPVPIPKRPKQQRNFSPPPSFSVPVTPVMDEEPLPAAELSQPVAKAKAKVQPSIPILAVSADEEDKNNYCTCHQRSYGQMLACDGKDCRYKWFHLECIGMTRTPKTKRWYCEECKQRGGAITMTAPTRSGSKKKKPRDGYYG
ncbi:hypothetical protein CYLTODRAFT_204356 [Cylindrobasidium torrendii FP15055 ss-10]|uniref:PHD-type domain-containing protein n=1 Tax=Cylindrobasidium torrendii FP15055 ss-10 TaxID=1314674 RepID=A0A0D7BIY2_9AGAR|nr:hypothetical protein CYLTODRAFT_204356 [Cylindrobasidium torrendii FP15055 ss-10]